MRCDPHAATSSLGSLLLLGVTLGLLSMAAVGLRPPSAADPAQRLTILTAVEPGGETIEISHHAGRALDPSRLEALVWAADVVYYSGPLGPAGEWWTVDEPLELRLTTPIPSGSPVDVLVRDPQTHVILATSRLQLPQAPPAAGPLAGFAVELRIDGFLTPPALARDAHFQVDVAVTHPGGRKMVRYVYADLSGIAGSSWASLDDDGTAGDRDASDGAFGRMFRMPANAPLGGGSISAYAVDLDGNRVGATVSLGISTTHGLVYALDPSASRAIETSGIGCLQIAGDIYVNSVASDALHTSGGGCEGHSPNGIVASNGGAIFTAGGYTPECCSPVPTIMSTAVADPLAALVMPTYGAGVWYAEGQAQPTRSMPPVGTPLQPGVYPGGLIFSGDSWIMEPGIYIVDGGKFSLSGSSALSGQGVFIYITSSSGACEGFSVSGGAAIDLTAPASGTYEGIVIAQDRSCSAGDSLSGGGALHVSGIVYLPAARLTLSGGSEMSVLNTILVTNTLTITGGGFTVVRP